MQTLLIPSIRDKTVCTKPQMDSFFFNIPELYIEYVNIHAKMVNFLHVTNDCVRKHQVEERIVIYITLQQQHGLNS